jgi:nitrogen fixation protein FixH
MVFAFTGDAAGPAKGQHDGVLTVHFADRSGAPLSGLTVSAILTRPTREGYDFSLPLANQGDGSYRANVTMPLRGLWEVRILAALGNARFQDTRRLLVP